MEPPTLQYPVGRFEAPGGYDAKSLSRWISEIAALPGWLDVVVENLDEAQLHTPCRPGAWSPNSIIHHLADSHMNAYIRFKCALTEHEPVITPYDQDAWAKLHDSLAEPVNISITLLHAMHRRWVSLMRSMEPGAWERRYFHPEYKEHVPLWRVAAMYAWHGRHHMEQIRSFRERMSW